MIKIRYSSGIQYESMPYKDYLQTAHWQAFRKHILKRDRKCQVCGNGNTQLDCHHLNYERRGCEKLTDIIVLCHKCHGNLHKGHYRVVETVKVKKAELKDNAKKLRAKRYRNLYSKNYKDIMSGKIKA